MKSMEELKQAIQVNGASMGIGSNEVEKVLKTIDTAEETLKMTSDTVSYSLSYFVDGKGESGIAIYEDALKFLDTEEEQLEFINNFFSTIKNTPAMSGELGKRLVELKNGVEKLNKELKEKGYTPKHKAKFSGKNFKELAINATAKRNEKTIDKMFESLAKEEKEGKHINSDKLLASVEKTMGEIQSRVPNLNKKNSRSNQIVSRAVRSDILSLVQLQNNLEDKVENARTGDDGSADEIADVIINDMLRGKTKYFGSQADKDAAFEYFKTYKLSDKKRREIEDAISKIEIWEKGKKKPRGTRILDYAKNEYNPFGAIDRFLSKENKATAKRMQEYAGLSDAEILGQRKVIEENVAKVMKKRGFSYSESVDDGFRKLYATHPVTKVKEPQKTSGSIKALTRAEKEKAEMTKKRAGAFSAGKVVEQDSTHLDKLKNLRNSSASPTMLDNYASQGVEVKVVDIENWYDPNNPNDHSKNKPITYAEATYNAQDKKFNDAKYYYVRDDKSVENLFTFLTDDNIGESRQGIAEELGFVDENGKPLNGEQILALDKKEVDSFIEDFYSGKTKGINTVTNREMKIGSLGQDYDFISPEQYANSLRGRVVISANKSHDVPILESYAGTKIETKALIDLFDMEGQTPNTVKLSDNARYLGGLTAGVYSAFFDMVNENAHNAKADVDSEASVALTMSKDLSAAISFLNEEAEIALETYKKENGISAIDSNGKIKSEAQDWFRGYFLKRADVIQASVGGNPNNPMSSSLGGSEKDALDYKSLTKSGIDTFKRSLSSGGQKYFSAKGLGKRLEVNISGIAQGQGEEYVESSAEEELISLFTWANQNGFAVFWDKTESSGQEKYQFYIVPEEMYDENNLDATKESSYTFSWIAPNEKGLLNSNNINSATNFFYDPSQKKYMDVNTWGLAQHIDTIKTYGAKKPTDSNYKTVADVNRQLSAQSISMREAAPIQANGVKDYEALRWDEWELSPNDASAQEQRRADAKMNWFASLSKFIKENSSVRERLAQITGIKEDFKYWELPKQVQDLVGKYLMERTLNPQNWEEAIKKGKDEELKQFISSPELKKLLEGLDFFFLQGGGFYTSSLSSRSVGTGKGFANFDADVSFTDILPMQSISSENISKGVENSSNRKIASYEDLINTGIWSESSLRGNDGKNSSSLVVKTMMLPQEILQRALELSNPDAKYQEQITEERLLGDEDFQRTATYLGNARKEKVNFNDVNEDFWNTIGQTLQDMESYDIGTTFQVDPVFQHATGKDIQLSSNFTIPANSYITSIVRTEDGIEVKYLTQTELQQAQKLVDTGTPQRHEFAKVTHDNIIDAINESSLSGEEKQALIDTINNNNVHTFKMQTPLKRSSSMRVGGSFNEGLWEYLVNQIKTKEEFDKVVEQVKPFGARYKWEDGKGVVSNLTFKNGVATTLDGKNLYEDESIWEGMDLALDDRAAYMANVVDSIDGEKVSFGSMYHDVAKALGITDKNIVGALGLISPNATSVAEYSGMGGIGELDRGDSRARFTTRAKENLKTKLDRLVKKGEISQQQSDDFYQEILETYGGDKRDIDTYNAINSAARNKTLAEEGKTNVRVMDLVFGNPTRDNQIDISGRDLSTPSGANMTAEEYKNSFVGWLYDTVRKATGKELGEDVQVRLSFAGLDPVAVNTLKSLGFKDGQILAFGPEMLEDNGKVGIQRNDRATMDYLRNAGLVASGGQVESNYLTKITNRKGKKIKPSASGVYRANLREQTKSGTDLSKRAASAKALMSANMKVVSLAGDADYGVISYQGALDLLGLGNSPHEQDIKSSYSKIIEAINGDKELKEYMTDEGMLDGFLDSKGQLKTNLKGKYKNISSTYQKLVENYVSALSNTDKTLPAWFLRNPVINEGNLQGGIKINNKESNQAPNVIMLPNMLAELLNADFDGDMIQVFFNLATKNSEVAQKIINSLIEEAKKTAETLDKFDDDSGKNAREDYENALRRDAKTLTHPQANASFGISTKYGQRELGLISYENTESQARLSHYRDLHKDDSTEVKNRREIRDALIGTFFAEVGEQKGISSKKSIDEATENPDEMIDTQELLALREALFHFTNSEFQKELIRKYMADKDGDSSKFSENSKLQSQIVSLINSFGEETVKSAGVWDTEALKEGKYVLSEQGVFDMLSHVAQVNKEAMYGPNAGGYRVARDQYFKELNIGTVGGAAPPVYFTEEKDAVSNVNGELDEHSALLKDAIALESKKAQISGNVADSVNEEADSIRNSNQALEEHIDTFEQYRKKVNFTGVDALKVTRKEKENGKGHYYVDEQGNEVKSFTQISGILENPDGKPFFAKQQQAWDIANKVWNDETRAITKEDLGYESDEDFRGFTESMGTALRGDIIHEIIDQMAKSGKSVADLKDGGWKSLVEGNSAIQGYYHELGKIGLGEDYVDTDNRIESYLMLLEKLGINMTKASELVLGMTLHGSEGDFKVAGTIDQLYSYGNGQLFLGDTKNYGANGKHGVQLGLATQALIANKDLLENLFYDPNNPNATDAVKAITDGIETIIMSLVEEGAKAVHIIPPNSNDVYAMVGYADKIERGEVNSLGTTDEKDYMGAVGAVVGTAQTEEQRQRASYNESDAEKAISTHIAKYSKLYDIQNKIYKLIKLSDILEGDKKSKNDAQLAIAQAEYQEELKTLSVLDEENNLLGEIPLTQEQIDRLKEEKQQIQTKYIGKRSEIDADVKIQENAVQSKKITDYAQALKKQNSYERDIAKLRKDMEGQSGEQLKKSQTYLDVLQKQYNKYAEITSGYDRAQGTLNGVKLTEESIAILEKKISEEQGNHAVKMSAINNQYSKQQGLLSQIAGGFKVAFRNITDASLAYSIINKVKQGINEVITATKNLDKQLVNIQIATGQTRKETQALLVDYSDLADELGRTTESVATASNDWLRAGYEGKEAAELTRASMMLSTLGMIDASDATTYLISTLKGWKIEANEVIGVVDKLTAVDMQAAISAGDLALAMSRANASARLAGSDMDKFIGYVTTVADVTQKSAESVGESFKTIYSRFGNVKAGKFAASQEEMNSADYNEDEFEALNDIETVLDSVGIKLRENAKEWRNIDDILADIANNWDNWDQTTKNAVSTAVAGTRQRENVLQLFDNWDSVAKYEKIAENSYGTAIEKMSAYTDSIEASQQRVQVAIEKWALWFKGNDTIKRFYDALGGVIENLHAFGVALMAIALATNGDKIFSTIGNGLSKVGMKLSDLSVFGTKFGLTSDEQAEYKKKRKEDRETYNNENWVGTQQRMFQNSFDRTIEKNELTPTQALGAKNMQSYVLGLKPQEKEQLAKNLRSGGTNFAEKGIGKQKQIQYSMRYNEATKKYETSSQIIEVDKEILKPTKFSNQNDPINLASALLEKGMKEEYQGVLEKIKQGELSNLSEKELELANKALAEAREDGVVQEIADEAEYSAELGTYKDARIRGALQTAGAGVGAYGMGSLGSNLLEGKEFLGLDLGPVGATLGGTLGLSIGQSAGDSIFDGIKNAKGKDKKLSAFFSGIGAMGGISIGISFVSAAVSAIRQGLEAQKKELEETFKELEESYSAVKGSDVDAERYDELSKGVDSLGRNISLTDEEYSEFLEISNSLAELFPELVARTDEEGNALLGNGNKVSTVTDKVKELIKAKQEAADTALFEETGGIPVLSDIPILSELFGLGKTSLFKEAYKEAQQEAIKANDSIQTIQNNISNSSLNDDGYIVGNDFAQYLKDNGYSLEAKYGLSQDGSERIAYGYYISDYAELTKQELQQLSDEYDAFVGKQKIALAESEKELQNSAKSMESYTQALLRQDSLISSELEGLTDEQNQFINNVVSSLGLLGREDEDYQKLVKEKAQEIIDYLQNEDFSNAVDIYFNPDVTMSSQAFESSRDELLYGIVATFPNMTLDEQKKLLVYFGFSWDGTIDDANGNGAIDFDEIVDEQNFRQKIIDEGLNKYLTFDLNSYASNFSVEEMEAALGILRNAVTGLTYDYERLKEASFEVVANNKSLTSLASMYESYTESGDNLTDIEKIQKTILEKQLDSWAESLGVVDGNYDEILKKAKALGDLTYGGLTKLTPTQVEEKYDDYKKYYDYMKNDFNGTWDTEKLSAISADADLGYLINDPTALTAKIKEFLDNGKQLYRKAIAEQVGSTEEGYKTLLENQDEAIADFADNYMIDLENFTTVQEAEATINSYITGLMNDDYQTWVTAMSAYYAEDLEQFTTAAEKKAEINSMILGQLRAQGVEVDGATISSWMKEYQASGGKIYDEETGKLSEGWVDYEGQKTIALQKEYIQTTREKALEDSKAELNAILEKYAQDIKVDFTGQGSAGKTALELLQDAEAAINKEWEAMQVFGTDKETAYFDKMRDNLTQQKGLLEGLMASTTSEKERLDYMKQLEEVEVKLANLDDEELEDKMNLLETSESTVAAQIALQRELVKAADTEEELIERQKKLNELLREEQKLRKDIRAYQRELIDTELEYESGTPDGDRYKELIKQQEELYAQDMAQAKLAIQDARNEAYLSYKANNTDDYGNQLLTDSELWNLANNSENVQEAVKNYIEAFQSAAELAMKVVEDNINVLDKKLDKLENERPSDWTNSSDINSFYNDKINILNDKIDLWEDALKETNDLTDEQITELVESINDATKEIQEAKIARREDLKEQDDKYYEAITWQVNQYIDEIELAKKANDDWYDDAIKKLQDYNDDLDRTNKLLELQNKLKTASQEKERVYREGVGWVYEAPRQKIKEAQDELNDFYRQDQIDDLNNTKDTEDKILDDRIQNWQDYLTMLENKYGEYEALENQRILMERMNVDTQEEIDAIIKKDMEDFVTYTESKMDESIGNYYEFYTKFESWFDTFFDSYTDNLKELAKLNEEFLKLLDIDDYLNGNGMNIEGGLGTLGTLSAEDRAAIYSKVQLEGIDYSDEMDKAIARGDFEAAQEYALLREAKADLKGITLGQGNYRTNQQVWDDAMEKYGKTLANANLEGTETLKNAISSLNNTVTATNSKSVTSTNTTNSLLQSLTSQANTSITKLNLTTQEGTGGTIAAVYEVVDSIQLLGKEIEVLSNGSNEMLNGIGLTNSELEELLAMGYEVSLGTYTAYDGSVGNLYLDPNKKAPVYNNADEDPGVIGSQAWLNEVRGKGIYTDAEIIDIIADMAAQNAENEFAKSVTSMARNTALANQTVVTGGYTVTYNSLGYAVSKIKNDATGVRDDGTTIYTNRSGEEQIVNTNDFVKSDVIASNIKAVATAMDGMGYNVDSVGSVIAQQIAASSKEVITADQAKALADQIIASGINNNTASLVSGTTLTNELITSLGTSVTSAVEYLKSIDSSTATAINTAYSYTSSSSSSSGSSGKYSGTSDYGFGDASYSSGSGSSGSTSYSGTINLNENYTALANDALKSGDTAKAAEYAAMANAKTNSSDYKGSIDHVEYNSSTGLYEGVKKNGYATGIKGGPVTYTGLTMLHGTPQEPEYVLNNDQAYNLLYNLSASRNAKMAEFDRVKNADTGTQYIVQGDIILEGVDDPAAFWQEVTNAMGNRWNVTKNK